MFAILKRELRSYFITPAGFIFMGLFLLLTGIFFTFGNLFPRRSEYAGFLGGIIFIFLFAIPILTMRLFAEEKKQKTDQLLLTSPVSIAGIVCGKFFAAMAVFTATLFVTVAYIAVIAAYGDLQTWETLGSYIGFIFLGACYVSLGCFISASTENQVTAALLTFFTLIIIQILDPLSQAIPSHTRGGAISACVLLALVAIFLFLSTRNWIIALAVVALGAIAIAALYSFSRSIFFGFIQNFLGWFSLNRRYESFSAGLLRVDSLLYYASFTSLFLFLTVRLIEKRRWS